MSLSSRKGELYRLGPQGEFLNGSVACNYIRGREQVKIQVRWAVGEIGEPLGYRALESAVLKFMASTMASPLIIF